jgi:hypothetical protein
MAGQRVEGELELIRHGASLKNGNVQIVSYRVH